MGVIVKEALANGRLTPRGLATLTPRQRAVFGEQAARLDTSLDALALAAVLAQPWVDVVLSGAATPEHLHANLAALAVNYDEAAARALAEMAEPLATYWDTRKRLEWN
jgi:aryl-alcohol dehydrogenase-like predicted oxidoreductase